MAVCRCRHTFRHTSGPEGMVAYSAHICAPARESPAAGEKDQAEPRFDATATTKVIRRFYFQRHNMIEHVVPLSTIARCPYAEIVRLWHQIQKVDVKVDFARSDRC